MKNTLAQTIAAFESLTPQSVPDLARIYAPHARFIDPFNDVQGLAQIQAIFRHMFETLEQPRFVVSGSVVERDQCFLLWNFQFRFRSFRRDVAQTIAGTSHLHFDAKGLIERCAALHTQVPVPVVAEFGADGRYVEADYDLGSQRLTVASVYVTKGGLPAREPARYERKVRFLAGLGDLLGVARTRATADGREFLCVGDYNLAASPDDHYHGDVARPLEGYLPGVAPSPRG